MREQQLEEARELASNLVGTLDHLANIHATLSISDIEQKPLAAIFAMLHGQASRMLSVIDH